MKTLKKIINKEISNSTIQKMNSRIGGEKKSQVDDTKEEISLKILYEDLRLLEQSLEMDIICEEEFIWKKKLIKEKKNDLIEKKELIIKQQNQEKIFILNELLNHNLISKAEFDEKILRIS